MGPNFNCGKKTIGRQRLPDGLVAILDDPEALCGAIRELHGYANDVRVTDRLRRGIVYRAVSESERQAITYKLQNLFGMKRFVLEEQTYAVPAGHWHMMDDRSLSHVHARHADPKTEAAHGQLALTVSDFCRIPEVVHSRNIVDFCVAKGKPRIVYEHSVEGGTLRVVEEIQGKGLMLKTVYKIK